MVSKVIMLVFLIFLSLQLGPSIAQTNLTRVGYYSYSEDLITVSEINSSLFTHLICGFASLDTASHQIHPSDICLSNFTQTLKQKNPSIATLLSIGGDLTNSSTNISLMVTNSSYRKSFIDSSVSLARLYDFHGLDFSWIYPETESDKSNMGILLQEWRAAISSEARNSSKSELILTARVQYSSSYTGKYPIDSMQQYLDWVHVIGSDYSKPESHSSSTGANAALYDPIPGSDRNTDFGISAWINGGLLANKLVLELPYYGFAWTLVNPANNGVGAPATGPAISQDGYMSYKEIKNYIERNGPNAQIMYNETYVVNYCSIENYWIGFDDVEAIRAKISYAKEKKLRGYHVWQVSFDHNWVLSQTAAGINISVPSPEEDHKNGKNNKRRSLVIILSTTAAFILLLGTFVICYCCRRKLKFKGASDSSKQSNDKVNKAAAAGDFNCNTPTLIEYTWADIDVATNGFSVKNKLGQGGYGPVYKGVLPNGQIIAVKKLSKTSTQGFDEFKNEVMLTAKLQHVNLVRVLGFCIDQEEQILVYEYMPNRSLDSYLFDPIRRYVLDWKKRVHIIEGITQGLLYLQEYSRLTIIHRDLKASNVLLDEEMKPKISDFGMARIFAKDDLEANTRNIVGTLGYVPPEYIQKGIYSTKSDVYSFGILLLQIISGRRISLFYGSKNLSLPHYAYELWTSGKGIEFMDESLDDASCSCKLMRCLHIALLCIQENPVDRPSMLEVFSMLNNGNTDMIIPKKPGFSNQNERINTTVPLERYSGSTSSINDVTVTDVLAR